MDDTTFKLLQWDAQGFCCSQILMLLALEDMGEDNPPLVRSMAGLCEGLSDRSGICGAASGAACVLALYAGKGSDQEQSLESLPLLLSGFMEWFTENSLSWGGMRCEDIIAFHGAEHKEACGNIILQARARILELLAEYDIDPTMPKE
ncbi:MAG: hypothetical protein CSA33_08735 [Desulfobulbus propionicus]|nr:MAG: hypothetical protein CSA33_08735 [Desulfobulbus propionicus]